jgi:hypothetical protein
VRPLRIPEDSSDWSQSKSALQMLGRQEKDDEVKREESWTNQRLKRDISTASRDNFLAVDTVYRMAENK